MLLLIFDPLTSTLSLRPPHLLERYVVYRVFRYIKVSKVTMRKWQVVMSKIVIFSDEAWNTIRNFGIIWTSHRKLHRDIDTYVCSLNHKILRWKENSHADLKYLTSFLSSAFIIRTIILRLEECIAMKLFFK